MYTLKLFEEFWQIYVHWLKIWKHKGLWKSHEDTRGFNFNKNNCLTANIISWHESSILFSFPNWSQQWKTGFKSWSVSVVWSWIIILMYSAFPCYDTILYTIMIRLKLCFHHQVWRGLTGSDWFWLVLTGLHQTRLMFVHVDFITVFPYRVDS